jgi:hypothetical protein
LPIPYYLMDVKLCPRNFSLFTHSVSSPPKVSGSA